MTVTSMKEKFSTVFDELDELAARKALRVREDNRDTKREKLLRERLREINGEKVKNFDKEKAIPADRLAEMLAYAAANPGLSLDDLAKKTDYYPSAWKKILSKKDALARSML